MKKFTKPVTDYVRDMDAIVEPSSAGLHFQTDMKQKTLCGGFLSLAVTIYVIFFVYTKGSMMFKRDEPNMASLEEQMKYEDVGKISVANTAKVLFEILENGDNPVDLFAGENYRQYAHIRLCQIIKTYDDAGKETVTKSCDFDLKRCDESNFAKG
jgi:hypothetical protein